jgi:glyoxylase-like metal-dependent hydrolase (beta-lactamase superfamily II)
MTTSVHLLHAGYVRGGGRVGSSVTLVRDGDALIVADPGMVASRAAILAPLAELGVAPEAVTHVFLSHHHPDHTINVALFPNAEVVDFWARYRDDLWLDHAGDGYELAAHSRLWLTPGHTEEDATLVVEADDAVYALTHLWWLGDRTPVIDPLAWDQAALEKGRERVLAAADIVIPGHGEAFRVRG